MQDVQILKIEDDIYHAMQEISQSKIIEFIKDPRAYEYLYIIKGVSNPDNDTEATGLGSAAHKWFFEMATFWAAYYLADFKPPSSTHQKAFAHAIFDRELPRDPIDAYKNIYSVKGKGDGVIKAAVDELMVDMAGYGKYLKEGKGRKLISLDVYNRAVDLRNIAEQHAEAAPLLFGIKDGLEYENEFVIIWKSPYSDLYLRSKIDRLILDKKNKKAIVVDYKTTRAVSIRQFIYSVRKYKYHIQADFYKTAVEKYLYAAYGVNYDVEFVFIPQNTSLHNQVLGVIELCETDLQVGHSEWSQALIDMDTCLTKNDFEMHPKSVSGRYVIETFDPNYKKLEEAVEGNKVEW